MLANKDAMATIAVKDIEVASRFYEETLGLKRAATEGSRGNRVQQREVYGARLPFPVRRD